MDQKKLNKLQKKIEGMSSNSLRRVYPEQMKEWLDLSDIETKEFLDELIQERLIISKYDFDCTCGNHCTVFLEKLKNYNYYCQECGKEYTFSMLNDYGNLIFELDKKEILDFSEETIDFKDLVKSKNKVVALNIVKGDTGKMEKKKIFIGSSKNVLLKVGEIARYIDDLGGEAKPWNAKGLFVAGQYTFDSLINIAHKMDGAIFMFNGEDETWYSDTLKSEKEVRDNVLLEYGLFAGILGRDKVAFICENNPKIASDLSGITYIKGDQSEFQIKPDIEAWLNQI